MVIDLLLQCILKRVLCVQIPGNSLGGSFLFQHESCAQSEVHKKNVEFGLAELL